MATGIELGPIRTTPPLRCKGPIPKNYVLPLSIQPEIAIKPGTPRVVDCPYAQLADWGVVLCTALTPLPPEEEASLRGEIREMESEGIGKFVTPRHQELKIAYEKLERHSTPPCRLTYE